MALLTLFLAAIGTSLVLHVYTIYKNYLVAKPLGLPIVFSPMDPYGLACQLSIRVLTPLFKMLPFELGTRWCRVADVTWAWESDGAMHDRLGPNFVMVTPGRNLLNTADPETIREVFARRKDFLKPDVYGECGILRARLRLMSGREFGVLWGQFGYCECGSFVDFCGFVCLRLVFCFQLLRVSLAFGV
jgi:hypothetical protein